MTYVTDTWTYAMLDPDHSWTLRAQMISPEEVREIIAEPHVLSIKHEDAAKSFSEFYGKPVKARLKYIYPQRGDKVIVGLVGRPGSVIRWWKVEVDHDD